MNRIGVWMMVAVLCGVACPGRTSRTAGDADDAGDEVVFPVFAPDACSLRLVDGQPPAGTLLVTSEEEYQARFECFEGPGKPIERPSGIDFSRNHLAVFGAGGDARAPDFDRLERSGNRLTAFFGTVKYCGGAPPFPIVAIRMFLVPKQSFALVSKTFDLPAEDCPRDLP
mgnify:CR=1 FL=1